MPYVISALVLAVSLVAGSAQAASILVNGSFEIGPAIPTNDIELLGGSTAITGWTVTGTAIDYLGPPWDVSDGQRAVDLDGFFRTGGIQQTFSTTTGREYFVSFDLSGNPQGLPTTKSMRVAVDGNFLDLTHDSSAQTLDNLIWQSIGFSFIASGPSATISFLSLSPGGNAYGALIDNVSVVPEPTILLLLGTGLAAVVYRRRRKN